MTQVAKRSHRLAPNKLNTRPSPSAGLLATGRSQRWHESPQTPEKDIEKHLNGMWDSYAIGCISGGHIEKDMLSRRTRINNIHRITWSLHLEWPARRPGRTYGRPS